jgi:hypothetical protein
MSNPVPLPSIEEIDSIDRKRQQAVEALEISEAERLVKCQKCGRWVKMLSEPYQPKSDRRMHLQNMVRTLEKQKQESGGISEPKQAALKSLKSELDGLLENYKKNDLMRSLPVHYIRGKFRCIDCI